MKILQVTAVDFTIEKFLLPLIDAQLKEGDEVHIACNCGEISEKLRNKGYKLFHIAFSRNLNVFSHVINTFRLAKLMKSQKYDCIHAHTPVASIISRLAAKLARVPVIIYTAHGFYFHENMNAIVYKFIYLLEKICGKFLTDYIFFQSKEDYLLALDKKFNKKERLIHIGNGVSKKRFEPDFYNRAEKREELGIESDTIVFVFVGRMVKEKGVAELVEAFDKVNGNSPDTKLVIVGGSVEGDRKSVDLDELFRNVEEDTKKNILVLGARNDIPEILSASDIFVLPSYREGLPRSIIEAMAMQLPIIATDIRGCREEVIEGLNGYLCKTKDSHDLEKKMIALLQNPENILEFGLQSRALFLSDFDEEVVLEKQLSIFRKIGKESF